MNTKEQQDPQTYKIIGAAMEVHGQLGCGFLEPVYQASLAVELNNRGIPFVREAPLEICYKGVVLECAYRADFICYSEIIVELKALAQISSVEQSQLINYLRASGFHRGLLLNFGAPRLGYQRFVVGNDPMQPPRLDDSSK